MSLATTTSTGTGRSTPTFLHRSRVTTGMPPPQDHRSRTEPAIDDVAVVELAPAASLMRVPASFDDFYTGEYEPMVRLASLIIGSTETAEELVQDSFIRLHQRWDGVDNPRAYLRMTVVNGCRDRIRRRTRLRARVPMLTAEARNASVQTPTSGERTDLVAALRNLPLRQRAALVLRFYGGFSESEIAETLGVQRGTVKSLVHRGLEQLREEIEP